MESTGMKLDRLTDLSLIYFIREVILPKNRYYSINNSESLTVVTGTSSLQWQAKNPRWVYHNPDSTTLTNLNAPATITPTGGTLDYINYNLGRVYFTVAPSAVSATYSAQIVNVIDGFPSPELFENLKLPIVAVEYDDKARTGLAIGGGHFVDFNHSIYVWAENDGSRDDLTAVIEEGLQVKLPIFNYNSGFPLSNTYTSQGSINTAFSRGQMTAGQFLGVKSRNIRIPTSIDKERHRSIINTTIRVVRGTSGVV